MKHYRSCNLCDSICGVVITHENGRIIDIRGDEEDPFSKGYVCPKVMGLKDLVEDPNRLTEPHRRVGNTWEKISWDDAFDEVATRLKDIQSRHGHNALAYYLGNPSVHNIGTLTYGLAFFLALKTRQRFSATSVDQLPRMFVSYFMYGHQLLFPIPDLENSEYVLMLGANPIITGGSLMVAPGMPRRIKALRARGGKLIVIDPRKTETAEAATEHHFIRPGTDAYWLLGIIYVLFEEHLVRPGRLDAFSDGLSNFPVIVRPYSPEAVQSVTGIAASTTRRLAREFANASSAVCYGRVGISMQEFGGLATWLIDLLNILTGNMDRRGGAMFTRPAVDPLPLAVRIGMAGSYDRYRSRIRALPEFSGEFPASIMAEEIETAGDGQIRALITSCGNPVLSVPNGRRLEKALPQLEFMVSIDPFINETTRHAHIILPPTMTLEHDNFDLGFYLMTVRNIAKYSPALLKKPLHARHDWEIFAELLSRMPNKRTITGRIKSKIRRSVMYQLEPRGFIDLALRLGPYGQFTFSREHVSLKQLLQHPHGLDLGALEPSLPERLFTKGKRIDLTPLPLLEDLDRLRERFATSAEDRAPELSLIGRRQLRSNNSWMHNVERLVKGKDRCTLLMHTTDAAARNLRSGDGVFIQSRIGRIETTVEISDAIMPGVVSLPHGWGHHRPDTRLDVAAAHAGVSFNDIADETLYDALCGTAILNGIPVQVGAISPLAAVSAA